MTTTARPAETLPEQRRPALDELEAALRGPLALPGSEAYDRLTAAFNAAVAVRPLAVVDAADAYDVATAVRIAGRSGLRVAVQRTGHGAVAVDGALLVHTGRLDECLVSADGWARVGAGVLWSTVVEAAAPLGLAPLSGSSSGVGVVGYTTGGGIGPLARTYGYASDRVRALDVVTGDGRLVRATPTEHAELFWALRGGKGSLGIVTAVEFDLVPVRSVYAGALHFDGADAATVLHTWRTWSAALPEQATTSVALRQLPPLPHVPPQLAGRMTVAVRFAWTGDPVEGEALLAPLRAAAAPVLDGTGVLPYTALDAVHQDPTSPVPGREGSCLLRELPAEAVDALLRVAGPASGSPLVMAELRQLGGALARRPEHDSAVPFRDAAFSFMCVGLAVPPVVDAVTARCREVVAALAPWSTGTRQPNFGGELPAYDGATLARLRSLVLDCDPRRVLLAADPLFAEV